MLQINFFENVGFSTDSLGAERSAKRNPEDFKEKTTRLYTAEHLYGFEYSIKANRKAAPTRGLPLPCLFSCRICLIFCRICQALLRLSVLDTKWTYCSSWRFIPPPPPLSPPPSSRTTHKQAYLSGCP